MYRHPFEQFNIDSESELQIRKNMDEWRLIGTSLFNIEPYIIEQLIEKNLGLITSESDAAIFLHETASYSLLECLMPFSQTPQDLDRWVFAILGEIALAIDFQILSKHYRHETIDWDETRQTIMQNVEEAHKIWPLLEINLHSIP